MIAINGFINLYKPADWTSHDCVARLRRLLNTRKIGHGGTLDPKATGVLPVAVGKATRLLQYLPDGKAYQAVVRFGVTTTTDDLEGEIVTQQTAAALSLKDIEAALPQFLGKIDQTPPIYSAIQVDGKRLYQLARQGKTVEVPTRQVTIHQLTSQHWQPGEQPELTLNISCGPGTYIRSLARDLGNAVSTGATLASLVRTHSSGFDLTDSITLEEVDQTLRSGTLAPVAAEKAVQHLRAIALPPDLAHRWRMGQKLPISEQMMGAGLDELAAVFADAPSAPLRILDAKTQIFLGIGEIELGQPTVALPNAIDNDLDNDLNQASAPIKILSCSRVYLSQDGPGSTVISS